MWQQLRPRLVGFLVFGSLVVAMLPAPLRAQTDPMAKWKPNVGDQFICEISHSSFCGDWKCDGVDTIRFVIVDTSYYADGQHQNSVRATTRPIALHLTLYSWGNGWDSTEAPHTYRDTTLLALTAPQTLETSFNGYGVYNPSWTQIPLMQDTSIIFQGKSYPAEIGGAIFLPTLGWFFSMSGYQYPGICADYCTEETWSMSLIAAIKGNSYVRIGNHLNPLLLSIGGFVELDLTSGKDLTLEDPLGRSIRSWQMPVEAGLREITLNVADVPSGVYFLRISGAGIDEVKKVCIAH